MLYNIFSWEIHRDYSQMLFYSFIFHYYFICSNGYLIWIIYPKFTNSTAKIYTNDIVFYILKVRMYHFYFYIAMKNCRNIVIILNIAFVPWKSNLFEIMIELSQKPYFLSQLPNFRDLVSEMPVFFMSRERLLQ